MPTRRNIGVFAAVVISFVALAGTIAVLWGMQVIGVVLAKLLLVALLGLYVGFGVLIAVYRLIGKLE